MTSNEYTNIVVKKTKKTIILIIKKIPVKKKNRNIDTVINSEETNHCFTDVNIFTEYEKFETLLIEIIVKKETKFSIAR